MPRAKKPCKRCGAEAGRHEPKCRYFAPPPDAPRWEAPRAAPQPIKMRKRVFTIDHSDGSETTITVSGPAGAVKCSSTEQSLHVWTGESAPAQQPSNSATQQPSSPIVARSTDVSRSGEEYTVTDELNTVPGGTLGLSEEEISNPDVVMAALERTRGGMIARMSAEAGSSDVLLVPEGAN